MELEAKSKLLATELETGMQRDFEIRRLNAQSELLDKELQTAKHTMMAKNRELQQRLLEDQVPWPLSSCSLCLLHCTYRVGPFASHACQYLQPRISGNES